MELYVGNFSNVSLSMEHLWEIVSQNVENVSSCGIQHAETSFIGKKLKCLALSNKNSSQILCLAAKSILKNYLYNIAILELSKKNLGASKIYKLLKIFINFGKYLNVFKTIQQRIKSSDAV